MLSATGALEMEDFPPGRIALVSQSGGILGSLLSRAAGRGIGFSKLVVHRQRGRPRRLADFVDHLLEDDATARHRALHGGAAPAGPVPRRGGRGLRRLGKPIVAFKVGPLGSGRRTAAVSHTGALAGADRMYDALFRQLGVIRAQTFADLLDIPARWPPAAGCAAGGSLS